MARFAPLWGKRSLSPKLPTLTRKLWSRALPEKSSSFPSSILNTLRETKGQAKGPIPSCFHVSKMLSLRDVLEYFVQSPSPRIIIAPHINNKGDRYESHRANSSHTFGSPRST